MLKKLACIGLSLMIVITLNGCKKEDKINEYDKESNVNIVNAETDNSKKEALDERNKINEYNKESNVNMKITDEKLKNVDLSEYSKILTEEFGGTLEKDLANALGLPLKPIDGEFGGYIIGDDTISIKGSIVGDGFWVVQHKAIENFSIYGVKIGMKNEIAENILLNQITKIKDNNYFITDRIYLSLHIENDVITGISFTNHLIDRYGTLKNEKTIIVQNDIVGEWVLKKEISENGNAIPEKDTLARGVNVNFYSDETTQECGTISSGEGHDRSANYKLQNKKIQIVANEKVAQELNLKTGDIVREYDYLEINDKAVLRRKISTDDKKTEYRFYYKKAHSDAKYFFVDNTFVGAFENNKWISAFNDDPPTYDWSDKSDISLRNVFNVDGYNVYNLTEKVGKSTTVTSCSYMLGWTLVKKEDNVGFNLPFWPSQINEDTKVDSYDSGCIFDINGKFATNGEHDVLLKNFEVINEDTEIFNALAKLFEEKNIAQDKISIDKILKLDFNNDGSDERLVVANSLADAQGQDLYSVVIMFYENGSYEIIDSKFDREVSWYDGSFEYHFEGVYDFEGDGEYEICIKEMDYEWGYIHVFKKSNSSWSEILKGGFTHTMWW